MSLFQDRLKEAQENWNKGRDVAQRGTIPPGIYKMQLASANITESQSSGKLMIKREHIVSEGEFRGEIVYDNMMIETERGPEFIARWITAMGFEVCSDIADLENTVAAIANAAPIYTARVTHSGDFTNVNVQKLEGYASEPAQPAQAVPRPPKTETVPSPAAQPTPQAPAKKPAPAKFNTITAKAGLVDFAAEYGLTNINDGMSLDQIIEALKEYTWDTAIVTDPAQLELLRANGIDVDEVEPEVLPEDNTDLLAFCETWEIKVDPRWDRASLFSNLDTFTWNGDLLTPEEKTMLAEGGVTVTTPAPKKATPQKAATAKPKK